MHAGKDAFLRERSLRLLQISLAVVLDLASTQRVAVAELVAAISCTRERFEGQRMYLARAHVHKPPSPERGRRPRAMQLLQRRMLLRSNRSGRPSWE